jgi:putative ATP-dependent endonuclease of OLD family
MKIRSVEVRHFRSIEDAALPQCGGLNILIGKNNAGKSNMLGTIELVIIHLKGKRVVGPWRANRPHEEFTDRDVSTPMRVGIEFELPSALNAELRGRLGKEAPHLERSIEQIATHNSVVVIVAGSIADSGSYLFVEQIAVGKLARRDDDLTADGIRLLSVPRPVASELYRNYTLAQELNADLETLEQLRTGRRVPIEYIFEQPREERVRYLDVTHRPMRADLRAAITARLTTAKTPEEFQSGVMELIADIKQKMEELARRETEGSLSAFAGETRTIPGYVEWLIEALAEIPFLHLGERKQQIGREEAQTLLQLKVRRKGPDRLLTIQQAIRSLLGVTVDAFEPETSDGRSGEPKAEMDVGDFLVEANGAGIREALRIILDLELKQPQLVLIEEPEVHLHPGLSQVIARYLRDKSSDIQLFITTQSTDFIDSVSFKNLYLVSRDNTGKTTCDLIGGDDAVARVPAELGLRPSTIFMFDRLVFVEGASDEAVLRELARKLEVDLARSNVGFVHMGGVRNFAHFAAEATLEVFTRRRIRLWFVADRDERDDAEVGQMMQRLRDRARLVVLTKRELENYLLDPGTIVQFIKEKRRLAGVETDRVDVDSVRQALQEEIGGLKEEVIRLRLERKALGPVFLHTREVMGSLEERLDKGLAELTERKTKLGEDRNLVRTAVDAEWNLDAFRLVPGSTLLTKLAQRFGVVFSKHRGDSERLARLLPLESIDRELRELLEEISRERQED